MATFVKSGTTVTFSYIGYPTAYTSKPHQNMGISEDGTVRVYDRGVTEKYITLKIKDYHANLTNIRSFIETTANFAQNTFTFTPDSGHNAGNGDGGAQTVRYVDSNFIETQPVYQIYSYTIRLRVEV